MSEFQYCPQCATPLQDAHIGGEARKSCPESECGFIHWGNPVPVVAAIVEHEGHIILAHNKTWPPTWFGLITGFLERGETPESGVQREVEEELALTPHEVTFVGHYPFEQMNQIIIAYHVAATGTVVLNEELDEFKHVPPDKLTPWPFGTGYAVADWLQQRNAAGT
ncbi:NUDIX domain-containing protein [Hoyosella subflava]|uniref:NUDIX hydrolase n=1 Tax=Hoyosella subflava (strain DSM 45089 / JCM 17490 / NBRC 109087 / DQS3-9A1) TaxID=443218 RepID=F6ELT1_HOYSD|nr:NUDIX domain-containing protein [Hoyosella subflava]AEF41529.1 NUDIX hydrolase [Hoyosella subflava DQS3-9A1]